jgi:BlaI family transcriptional regulator, penicillinase repressor
MAVIKLGNLQLKIMRILWEKGRVNAREITDELNKEKFVAHSTVQTLLRKLEQKGAVDHETVERTFIFYPLVKSEQLTQNALKDFLDKMFSGSPKVLVSYLIKNEYISPDEIEDIHKKIKK